MKSDFYAYNFDGLVNLKEDSEPLKEDWNKRTSVKYIPETQIYHEIYNRQDYIKGDCIINPGDVVVDCGGNIGIFSSYALDMGAYRVLSFEPFPDNYELNRKNNPNAEVFNLAVSNRTGDELELLLSKSNGGHTIIQTEMDRDPKHYNKNNIFVKTITLDDIIKYNFIDHIDFLKIDTEGSEIKIIEGLSDHNLNKIRCIALEYHNAVFNFDDTIYTDFQKRFNRLGFNTFTWELDEYTRMLYISRGDVFIDNPRHKHIYE